MNMDPRDVKAALLKKGFVSANTHHIMLIYCRKDGRLSKYRTKISHNSGTLGSPLVGKMAAQCGLTKPDFQRFVECVLSRDDYESIVFAGPDD